MNERSRALFGGEEFVKWKALKALKEQESSGLTWTGIATGPFFDWVSFIAVVDTRGADVV